MAPSRNLQLIATAVLATVFVGQLAEAHKQRSCGGKLIQRLALICTPDGFEEPCITAGRRHVKRSVFRPYLVDGFKPTNPSDVSQTLSEQSQWRKQQSQDSIMSCCEDGCEDDFLASYCCDADELQAFKLERVARF